MAFVAKKATRRKIYGKFAIIAPSGGGKTYGACRLATGMAEEIKAETGKDATILMGNTEGDRGYYYANEFNYDIVDIEPPHNPEKYVELIDFAVEQGYDILIIDSASHEWEGKGGCLELHQQAGGTYQSWGRVTPRHNKFIQAISESPIHIIATMRGKDQYEMTKDDKGKTNVQKFGVGAKQRDGFEYEFTATFLVDQKTNTAEVQKDNTHIFDKEGPTILTEAHGRKIIQWANSGEGYAPIKKHTEEEVVDDLKAIKAQIITTAKAAGGPKDETVMSVIKKYVPGGNPNMVQDIDTAKQLLKELSELNK